MQYTTHAGTTSNGIMVTLYLKPPTIPEGLATEIIQTNQTAVNLTPGPPTTTTTLSTSLRITFTKKKTQSQDVEVSQINGHHYV
jgi:hypothetical protein